ncbi:DUF6318 family protein [Georgenia alba]|uniref:DUF6318 family protein n=1 Tax=Georgenia alba TaxID=2233858 RepID=A0ABW2QB34_9MICO
MLVTIGIASCDGGSEDPTQTPTHPPPETRHPEPGAAIARDDEHGAEEAARYFWSLYSYAYATGDLDEWRDLSHPECATCQTVVDRVTELHDAGGHAEGGMIRLDVIEATPPGEGDLYFNVHVEGTQEPLTHIGEGGDTLAESSGTEMNADMALARDADGWLVREVANNNEEQGEADG